MKALKIDQPAHLDGKSLNTLVDLLNTEITSLQGFQNLPANEQTFIDLITDGHLPGCVLVDWKWDVEELFSKIDDALKGHSIKLLNAQDDAKYLAYEVRFSIDDKNVDLTINSAEPNALFVKINEQLDDTEFINVDLGGDEFAWILIPKITSIRDLAELIGFCYIDSITVKRNGFPTRQSLLPKPFTEHFDINKPLANKILVNLVMRHRVNGVLQLVVVKDSQGNRIQYTFGVNPGQDYIDTMKQALKEGIGYDGGVELHKPQLIDNSRSSDVPTYEMQVYLVADVPADAGSGKYKLSFEETAEIY